MKHEHYYYKEDAPSSNQGVTIKKIRTIPGQHEAFCGENYLWGNTRIDEIVTSCVNESILRKVVSNEKDSFRLVTSNIKKTQLDNIKVLPGDEHIMPLSDSSSISFLSLIDLLSEEFTNFKIFVCQEQNFLKQELSDVKQNTNKNDRRNSNQETCNRNTLDEKIVLLGSNSFFVTRTTQQTNNYLKTFGQHPF